MNRHFPKAKNYWEPAIKALAEFGYKSALSNETNGFLTKTPLELYPSAMYHMTETGRYLICIFYEYSNK